MDKRQKVFLAAAAALALLILALEIGLLRDAVREAEREPEQASAQSSAGQAEQQPTAEPEPEAEAKPVDTGYSVTMVFSGDINLADNWSVMEYEAMQPNGIRDCIGPELISAMEQADLCCVNNEFCYSSGGEPMEDKMYTFRADPDNVSILRELGVDLVTLANNHVYDYGAEAFSDTLNTLSAAGIGYVGAGENLAEASEPVYYSMEGLTVAVVNASRAEKNRLTPGAEEDSSGIMLCYDTALFEQEIAEAAANADFVVCCVHWGTEYSYDLEEVQRETARTYIDAGADVIVGTHSHCLQGIEYYQGVPVFYSLGNFWFNEKRLATGLLSLEVTGNAEAGPELTCTFLPAIQEEYVTRYASAPEERSEVLDLLNEISLNARVDDTGLVRENPSE